MNNRESSLNLYRERVTQRRIIDIRSIILSLEKERARFTNITELSESIAKKLSVIEGKPVASSTLRRNVNYRILLDEHLSKLLPKLTSNEPDKIVTEKLRAYKLSKKLTAAYKNIKELKKELLDTRKLLSSRIALEHESLDRMILRKVDRITSSNDESIESLFEVIYVLLMDLGSIDFDVSQGVVYDSADDIVRLNRNDFPLFFKWLEKKL